MNYFIYLFFFYKIPDVKINFSVKKYNRGREKEFIINCYLVLFIELFEKIKCENFQQNIITKNLK